MSSNPESINDDGVFFENVKEIARQASVDIKSAERERSKKRALEAKRKRLETKNEKQKANVIFKDPPPSRKIAKRTVAPMIEDGVTCGFKPVEECVSCGWKNCVCSSNDSPLIKFKDPPHPRWHITPTSPGSSDDNPLVKVSDPPPVNMHQPKSGRPDAPMPLILSKCEGSQSKSGRPMKEHPQPAPELE